MNGSPTIDDVLATEELKSRPLRSANFRNENRLLKMMAAQMGNTPEKLLNRLVGRARTLCRAGSAGLSLLETDSCGNQIFRWVAMAGVYRKFVGGTTPRDFSPCGTCLDRGGPQLYRAPARYFKYLAGVEPPIHQGLVIPIAIGNEQLGTIWIVSHNRDRGFDGEDVRIMTSISAFLATVLRQKQLQSATVAALTAAQRSDEFSQKVLNSSPDCIKVLSHDARVVFMSNPGLVALKVKPSDVINKKWFSFWKGKDRRDAQEAFSAAKVGKDGRFQGYRPTFAGEPRWWDVIVTPLSHDSDGHPTYLCISRDVTERVRSGQQLTEANEKLAQHACSLESRVQRRTSELQSANEEMQSLARKLVRSQEDERRALARELHDDFGQHLTGLKLLLERTRSANSTCGELDLAITMVAKLQKQVQTLSFALRHSLPDHITLERALQWHFRQVEQSSRLRVHFECDRLREQYFAPEVRHTLFRIVQEALTNVVRHANVPEARVSLRQHADTISVEIVDQGIGFVRRKKQRSSTGLSGMQERVLLLGGALSLWSRVGNGTRVIATLPLKNRGERTPAT